MFKRSVRPALLRGNREIATTRNRDAGRVARSVAAAVAFVVAAGVVAALPASAQARGTDFERRVLEQEQPVAGQDLPTPAPSAPDPASTSASLPPVTWPGASTQSVDPVAGRGAVRAGQTPVSVGVPAEAASTQGAPAARTAAVDPNPVSVQVLDQDAARRAGVNGVLIQLGAPTESAARSAVAADPVSVSVDYSGFAGAFGGDWARRLRLVQYPSCVLSTPERAECRVATPVASRNLTAERRVVADLVSPTAAPGRQPVTLAEAQSSQQRAPGQSGSGQSEGAGVYAVAAAASGDSGDYGATTLASSASWSAGGSSGGFSWSMPFRVPPSSGGPAPSLSLGYSSQSVDGRTASTNNQSTWVGEGWDMWSGYIERRYKSCLEDPAPNQPQSADQCWATDNATILLNGQSTTLVRDQATGAWRMESDDGSRIEQLFGAVNGDDNGEHWRVTTQNGTQYIFGSNRLPGWASGRPETNSAWTVPVFGNNAGEPCNQSTFAASWCQQGWRFNLDQVIDPHGNAMVFFYDKEINHYGRAGSTATANTTPYVRGGTINRIGYGLRTDSMYALSPARVVFSTAERCLPDANFACDPSQRTAQNAHRWPDTPIDNNCNAGESCTGRIAPTFWTTKRLTEVTTQVLNGSAHRNVESWRLRHTFPAPGDGTTPALWVAGIQNVGQVGGTASTPEVTFTGTQLVNRVDALEGYAPMVKWRVARVRNESGGEVQVNYSAPDCRRADRMPANPHTNTLRCYPQWWAPPGQQLILDWFHKYVVDSVIEDDRTGGSQQQHTFYDYLGTPAWAYVDDELSKPERRTWSQWRGYERVRTRTGAPTSTQSVSEALFLRGLDGDRVNPSGGARDVWVTDSEGGRVEDHPRLAGFTREALTYDRVGGPVQSATLNDPWLRGPTATRGDLRAFQVRTERVRTRTLLESGQFRRTEQRTSYDDSGLVTQVDDLGDTATAADDRCTRTTYARNTSKWMLAFASRIEAVSVACAATPSRPTDVLSDIRSFYDGSTTHGTAPTRGLVTRVEHLDSWSNGPVYVTASRQNFDSTGRAIETFDALGNRSTSAYTPAVGGPVTQVATTNALGHTTTTTLEPAWGESLAEVDANGRRVEITYDPLGRLTQTWTPERPRSDGWSPASKFSYEYRTDAPTVVRAETVQDNGQYSATVQLFDGFLRVRQVQVPTAAGGERLISDTLFDSRGLEFVTTNPYLTSGDITTTIFAPNESQELPYTLTEYDAQQRVTASIFVVDNSERWRTTTRYGGDRVHVDPPAGGTPTTSITDARDQLVELRQYRGDAPTGAFEATRYGWTKGGLRETVTDAVGNTWRSVYDLRGRKIRDEDPDRGVTTMAYDVAGQLTSSTDSRGRTISTTFDTLGRPTARFDGQAGSGTKLADWTYDTLLKGAPTASTRYDKGNAYGQRVHGYDNANRPTGVVYTIPAAEGALAGEYTFRQIYTNTGLVKETRMPAGGGLAAETVYSFYDDAGQPTSTSSPVTEYVSETLYSQFGEQVRRTQGPSGKRTSTAAFFENGTRRLDRTIVATLGGTSREQADTSYSWDPAGNLTSIADRPLALAADVQCFGYDHLRRMTRAWTPAPVPTPADGRDVAGAPECAAAPSVAGAGGPEPYWRSYALDAAGSRTSEVDHLTAGGATTRTYGYPPAGSAQPRALRSVTTNGPSGQSIDTFTHDSAGAVTSRTLGGDTQTLAWDAEGWMSGATEADGVQSSFVYDAAGTRLIRRGEAGTTLYLGAMELFAPKNGGGVTGTRYYTHDGEVVAVRTSTEGVSWLFGDHQSTPQLAVSGTDLSVTRRRMLPFGAPRTPDAPASDLPGDRGFVGGTEDRTTGLTHIGARQYDPALGAFLSVDPLTDPTDPQRMHPYAYGNNAPATFADPTGMAYCGGPDGIQCLHPDSRPKGGIDKQINTRHRYEKTQQSLNRNPYGGIGRRSYVAPNSYRSINGSFAIARLKASAPRLTPQEREAQRIAAMSPLDILREEGGPLLMDLLGVTDIRNCFEQGDLVACGSMLLSAIPVGRLLRNGFAIGKAIERVVSFLIKKRDAIAFLRRNPPGSCAVNSFTPGTLVLMADGTRQPIETLGLGDLILATDPQTGLSSSQPVVATIIGTGPKNLVTLTFDTDGPTGTATGTVTATDHHPFHTPTGWTDADRLLPGSQVTTPTGTTITVLDTHHHRATTTVHNLTTAQIHTYNIHTNGTNALVHNCGGKRPPNMSPPDAGRRGAYRQAKRDAGIPMSQHPTATLPNVDRLGRPQPGYQYNFGKPGAPGTKVIRDDAGGHVFRGDPSQNRGPHFNGPNGDHYDY